MPSYGLLLVRHILGDEQQQMLCHYVQKKQPVVVRRYQSLLKSIPGSTSYLVWWSGACYNFSVVEMKSLQCGLPSVFRTQCMKL